MAYLARTLITKSYYLSGIVCRDLETVSGQQLSDGLDLLNALLDVKTTNSRLIPYYSRYEFNAVIGQEEYFIDNLIAIESLTFNIGELRYSMLETSRVKYFGTGRVDNIQSLPFNWHFEKEEGGGRLYLYFLPQDTYVMKISGKFALTDVEINTDLTTVYDRFYIEYLRYALAGFICDENDIEFTPNKAKRLQQYEKTLMDVAIPDLSMQKMSSLQQNTGLNYADVNIGRGWRPSAS